MIQGFWKVLLLQLYCWEMVHLLSWGCYYRKSSWTSRAFFVKSPWGIIKESERKSDLFVRICDRKKKLHRGKCSFFHPWNQGRDFTGLRLLFLREEGKLILFLFWEEENIITSILSLDASFLVTCIIGKNYGIRMVFPWSFRDDSLQLFNKFLWKF